MEVIVFEKCEVEEGGNDLGEFGFRGGDIALGKKIN